MLIFSIRGLVTVVVVLSLLLRNWVTASYWPSSCCRLLMLVACERLRCDLFIMCSNKGFVTRRDYE